MVFTSGNFVSLYVKYQDLKYIRRMSRSFGQICLHFVGLKTQNLITLDAYFYAQDRLLIIN